MLIKVCGIKNSDIANKAINLGADALGFVFAKSTRKISKEKAKDIIDNLSSDVLKVGVFVNSSLEEVNDYVDKLNLDVVQLHGDESYDYCKKVNAKVIKAISIKDKEDVQKVYNYKDLYGYLFDRKGEKYVGGEGKTFNWDFLNDLDENILKKLILAGGLKKENIKDAIMKVNPFMVDVSSGVEINGEKDETLIKEFIDEVRSIAKNI